MLFLESRCLRNVVVFLYQNNILCFFYQFTLHFILISLSVLLLMAARELGICEETSIRGLGSQLRTICYIWYTVYQLVAGVAGLSLGCFVAGHGHKLCEHQLFVINF